MKKSKFENVYYVVQTRPRLSVCGYTFTEDEANVMAQVVRELTGETGRIVHFTRKELKKLNYT